MSRAAKADTSQSLASGVEEKLAVISDSREADAALLGAALELRKARKLTPMLLVALREIRAMWALRLQRYEDAALHFARLERSFLANLEPEGARHARMGRARSLSRAGRHAEAEALLTRIFDEVDSADWNQRAEVSMALGMAFLRKDQGEDASSSPSLDKALAAFHKALHISAAGSQKRAFARLGIARVLGERGQLDEALDMFDRATSELAQLGHSSAKSLLNIRIDLNKGEWYRLILD